MRFSKNYATGIKAGSKQKRSGFIDAIKHFKIMLDQAIFDQKRSLASMTSCKWNLNNCRFTRSEDLLPTDSKRSSDFKWDPSSFWNMFSEKNEDEHENEQTDKQRINEVSKRKMDHQDLDDIESMLQHPGFSK